MTPEEIHDAMHTGWQARFLERMIEGAKGGNPECFDRLRYICKLAAERAPDADLIRIAEFLYEMRMDAARQHVEGN